jgi:hypothetical protein
MREGGLLNDPAVIALAHAVEMLGLRIQYLQSTMTTLAGGQIVKVHHSFEIPARNQVEKSG